MSDTSSPPPTQLPLVVDDARSIALAAPRPRLWPGAAIVGLQWLFLVVPGWIAPGSMFQIYGKFLAPVIGAVAFAVWWLFFSRIRSADRIFVLLACAATGAAVYPFCDPTFNLFGVFLYAVPVITTLWLLWLLATPFLSWPVRRVGLLVVFFLGWGHYALVRFEGVLGNLSGVLTYRWAPTDEDQAAAERSARLQPVAKPAAEVLVLRPGDWPGFRGANRDSRLSGFRIATDWEQRPPRLLWKQRVGPGWSSFAVIGNRLYTQEQWGDEEAVICYYADTGKELWVHKDTARFTEPVGGPGPRATPTFHESKLYVQGGKGRLNCLDAATGNVLWSRDVRSDVGADLPIWGFAASPLVADGVVTVFAGAPGKSVLGYRAASGELVWAGGNGKLSYSSPQLARFGGVEQVLFSTEAGLTAFHPASGDILWEHRWPTDMQRIAQPAVLGDSDVLFGTGFKLGTRRLKISRTPAGWTDEERWTTRAIKPYFNDLVVYQDHLYGFDSEFLTCVDLDKGKQGWRARDYGNGQVLLLADQGLLLVLSEQGEVALVEANPATHNELARFRAIEGKTWNHPVIAHGKLFVRNGKEMACYELNAE
jgi:outer membrane protein assembly factor BamB